MPRNTQWDDILRWIPELLSALIIIAVLLGALAFKRFSENKAPRKIDGFHYEERSPTATM